MTSIARGRFGEPPLPDLRLPSRAGNVAFAHESSGGKEAGVDFDVKDRIAGGRSFEGMGCDREQLCAVCQNPRLQAGESAADGDRQTFSERNSGRGHEKTRLEKLSRGDRAEKIAGRVADEFGRGPFRRRQIDAFPGDGGDRAGV